MKKIVTNIWKETKKEYNIDDIGNEIPTHVTKEKDFLIWGKDRVYFDFVFRSFIILAVAISIIGIAINIHIQNKQHAFDIYQKRAMFNLDIYSKAVKNINLLVNNPPNDSLWTKAKSELTNDVIPTIDLLNDDSLNTKILRFNKLADARSYYRQLIYINKISEKFYGEIQKYIFLNRGNLDKEVIQRIRRVVSGYASETEEKEQIWKDQKEDIIDNLDYVHYPGVGETYNQGEEGLHDFWIRINNIAFDIEHMTEKKFETIGDGLAPTPKYIYMFDSIDSAINVSMRNLRMNIIRLSKNNNPIISNH